MILFYQAIGSLEQLLKNKFSDDDEDIKPDVKKLSNDVKPLNSSDVVVEQKTTSSWVCALDQSSDSD